MVSCHELGAKWPQERGFSPTGGKAIPLPLAILLSLELA